MTTRIQVARIRNSKWKKDQELRQDIEQLVSGSWQRAEILDEMKRLYPNYAWSLRTLCLRMKHFGIKYVETTTPLDDVRNAVVEELKGPGQNLGYRAMHKKIRQIHNLKVGRDAVYLVMGEQDPEGLRRRGGVGESNRKPRNKAFRSLGSDFTVSLDGHDKLTGWGKTTYPLCIYGGQDTFSGKILFLKVWTSNNKPQIIGRYYYEYLEEYQVLPKRIRIDKGTETDIMTTIHVLCHMHMNPQKSKQDLIKANVLYGPSTENKIERWWGELHKRMEEFFKQQLRDLTYYGHYNYCDLLHQGLLAYVYIPVVQRELDDFRTVVWNRNRGRKQKNKMLPTGIPEHIYRNPEKFDGTHCGTELTSDFLAELEEVTGVMDDDFEFLTPGVRALCQKLLPEPHKIKSYDAADAYIALKNSPVWSAEGSSTVIQDYHRTTRLRFSSASLLASENGSELVSEP